MRSAWFACLVLALNAGPAAAQDPAKAAAAHYKVIAENERVRVLRGTMGPGEKTAMHEHPAHVAIALTPTSGTMTTPDGASAKVEIKAEEALLAPAGKHAVANTGSSPFEVVIVELKGPAGTGTLPATRQGINATTLLDDPRVRVARVSFAPTFKEPAGSTHDYDQVVVMLGPSDIALAMDGKTASAWKRGDVRLIGRGIAHETTAGRQMGDAIIVSVR